jgi:hypothetical protein
MPSPQPVGPPLRARGVRRLYCGRWSAIMQPYDLVLTPNGRWHGNQKVRSIDGLVFVGVADFRNN